MVSMERGVENLAYGARRAASWVGGGRGSCWMLRNGMNSEVIGDPRLVD